MKRFLFVRNRFFTFLISLFVMLLFQRCSTDHEPARHIILIGIDGVGVSGFQQARTPHLDELVRNGAISLGTRSVMPTVSAPNWGSHLLGAGPEQHGITYNGWTTTNHVVDPVVSDDQGYFPSIFTVIREQMPDAVTGFFYDWGGLSDLYNLSLIDKVELSENYTTTFEKATPWIIENKPVFTFLYIGHPDEEGHAHQWGSKEYIKAIEDVDAALGEFMTALREGGIFDKSHFIVVSDHGGVGYGHAGLGMEEIQTPWIISGPGILKDRIIQQPNYVMNTASTIAYMLNLEPPYAWTGRPVYGAFSNHPLAKSNTLSYVPQPTASISSGLFTASEAVSLAVSNPDVLIRFTVNGSNPDEGSPVYKSPILLQKSCVLKAAGFNEGSSSRITEVDFVKVLEVKDIQLSFLPDEKYPAQGETSLIDLQLASGQYNDGKWLGFRGVDLEAVITLKERADISRFSLGFLNNTNSWIFPPPLITVYASVDRNSFSQIGQLSLSDLKAPVINGRNEVSVNITPAQAKFLKVVVRNTGVCPPDHPGAGEQAWLFVDELIFE